jgi:Anthranilate/para-aminobenzoate synthases component I
MDKNKAINLMNEMGRDQIPFLFIIDSDMETPLVFPIAEIDKWELLFNINGFSNSSPQPVVKHAIVFDRFPISQAEYSLKFQKVMKQIAKGNTYLLNLTCPTRINTNLTLPEIFARSSARYKLWIRDSFVVFSPESFITIVDGKIASFPMKGTIDAALENAEHVILNDPKEIAEHHTIVDLIRNDLSMIATEVFVEKFRYVEKLRTSQGNLLQVSSKITGHLRTDYHKHIGDIVFTLLPAGSVTGAPKKKTVEIIRETENYNRGYYTGIFGYFDGAKLDSGVMIRFIEKTHEGMIYKSGGGITSFSRMESEYQEMIDKVYVPFN